MESYTLSSFYGWTKFKTKAHLVRNFPISDTVVACSYLDYQQPSTNSQVGSFLSRRSQMTWQCLKMLLDPLNKLGHQASAMLDSLLERIDEEHGFLSADQFGRSDAVCFHCWGPSLFDADDNKRYWTRKTRFGFMKSTRAYSNNLVRMAKNKTKLLSEAKIGNHWAMSSTSTEIDSWPLAGS